MQLLFATQNMGKYMEAKQVLISKGIDLQLLPFDFQEPTAGTFEKIALHKLNEVMGQGYQNVMVEDSGVFLEAYEAFPGVLSKRIFHGIGYRGFEKLLKDEDRSARLEGSFALYWQGEVNTFTGFTNGQIARMEKQDFSGEKGLPFDPIFIPQGEKKVFAQLSKRLQEKYSFRRKALLQMIGWINQGTGSIEKIDSSQE